MTEKVAHPKGLKVVDAFDLDPELRALLRPHEMAEGAGGRQHRLPRYFYEIPSHEHAKEVRLTPHFGLNEFILVDFKEAPLIRAYPRYIPCAVRLLAFYLERLREVLGQPVHLAVNGGYRSPVHKLAVGITPHMWGTAADLYRIGPTLLNERDSIEKYNSIAEDVSDDLWVMPYGHEIGLADDHIHVDLGYISLVPREMDEDRAEASDSGPRFAIEDRRSGDRRTPPPPAPAPAPPEPAGPALA